MALLQGTLITPLFIFTVAAVQQIGLITPLDSERLLPPDPIPPKPPEAQRPEEHIIFEKPTFLPKPISHSPKISPSSIPNPNPSVMTTKPLESGFSNYGSYPYSVPGFSAFQPYPGIAQGPVQNEAANTGFPQYQMVQKDAAIFPPRDAYSAIPPREQLVAKEPVPFQSPVKEHNIVNPSNITDEARPSKPISRDSASYKTHSLEPSSSPVAKEHNVYSPVASIPETMAYSPKTPREVQFSPKPLKDHHIPFPPVPTREPMRLPNAPINEMKSISVTQTNETISFTQGRKREAKEDLPFPTKFCKDFKIPPKKNLNEELAKQPNETKDLSKQQTDFEEHFTPEIIPATSNPEVIKSHHTESKMSITSLAQGSGATVTIPTQVKEVKKKPAERFSLKTSIPISKIDMKYMNTNADTRYHNIMSKNTFVAPPTKEVPKIEIQSNIVIKSAKHDSNAKNDQHIMKPPISTVNTSISNNIHTLINAAEAINKKDNMFQMPETKLEVAPEITDSNDIKSTPSSGPIYGPLINDTNKTHFKAPHDPSYNEPKNQIVFIQNKSSTNPKMLVTIQQQNPQVLLQRTNFDSKNLQAPSRLSHQIKKNNEEIVTEGIASKVVALKRLHQENCDENDFENLITENQIYGNKIVVKEKSQGVLQEQDLKMKTDKTQTESKNIMIQPNIVYLSNVQFPGNLMMIKNNTKITQTSDCVKTKVTTVENKLAHELNTMTNQETNFCNNASQPNLALSKELHVFNPPNILQSMSNISTPDVIIQANSNVIMNPQIVYQMPMIVESEKINQQFINCDYPNLNTQKNEVPKQFEQSKANDKLYIACPYQMDSKLQPKIVITNIRPKIPKVEELSTLDLYEKRRKLKRLKYLTNRDNKEVKDVKPDCKKMEKDDYHSIITPDNVRNEINKEFANTKVTVEEESSESESDDEEDELKEYDDIIKTYGAKVVSDDGKAQFLANFNLATLGDYKEKKMEIQEKALRNDSVASAYIAAGRLDILIKDTPAVHPTNETSDIVTETPPMIPEDSGVILHRKQVFLSRLQLKSVSTKYKEGYEKVWQEVIKERKRRTAKENSWDKVKQPKLTAPIMFNPNDQLQILTQIKKSVNENNNLIKKRLDSVSEGDGEESIRALAEKNFTELNKLSKMADRSVKILSGQDNKKRPGINTDDSQIFIKPIQPTINVPSLSKIISLRTVPESQAVKTTPAISMDEPRCSAAGVSEMFVECETDVAAKRDVSCQAHELPVWPGVNALMKSYREFETARKKTITDLHRRNTALRVESSYITRGVSQDTDSARALLAERKNLAAEEARLRRSIQRISDVIEVIKMC